MDDLMVGDVEAVDFPSMPSEYRDLVIHLLRTHAEGELTGSDVYARKLFAIAPSAMERYICCLRAAEEVDHYIKTARVLEEIGIDCSHMVAQSVRERNLYPLEAVRYEFERWEDRAAFSALAELVAHYQIENMADSSFRPLARICPGIMKEETGHVGHGWRILREMCATDDGRARAQEAVDRWFPIALDCFGSSTSARAALYVKWRIKKTGNEELRQQYLRDLPPKLEELGLTLPEPALHRKFM